MTTCSGITTPDPVYLDAIYYVDGTLTVAPAPVIVTGPTRNVTYGDPIPDLTPTYSPAITPATAAVCTTLYTATSSVTGSPYAITCGGAADPNYSFTYVDGTIIVAQAPVIVTGPTRNVTYGDPIPDLTPTYSPAITPATAAVCTTLYTATSSVTGSPYAITCGGAADPNYSFTYVDGTIIVAQAPVIVTGPTRNVTYGDPIPDLTPTYSPAITPATAAVCTTLYTATSSVTGSPYAITCGGAADPNYSFTYVDGTIIVAQAPVIVTGPTRNVTYGDPIPDLTPTYSPAITPATAAVCTTLYTATSSVTGSPYAITCGGAADPNYSFTYVDGTIIVAQAPVIVTGPTRNVTYGDPIPDLTPTYSPAITPATAAVCTTLYTATSSVTGSPYAITCGGAADPNYSFTYVDGTIIVAQAPLLITASSGTMVYGDTVLPVITPIYTTLVAGDLAPATPPVCVPNVTSTTPAGSYNSTCGSAADPNYAITYAWGTVVVTPAPQTITFGPLANMTWGQVAVIVSATASSGLPVTFTSETPVTCTNFGPGVFLVSPGTCTITASQSGLPNYLPATPVSQSFNIAQAASGATVTADFNPTRIGAPVTLSVSVTSPNPLAGTPSGSVQLYVDGVATGAAVALDVTGHASIVESTIPLGVHSLTVSYLGDTFFLGTTTAALSHTVVALLTTTTAVTSSLNPSVRGQYVTFTATITPQNASLGVAPSGTVQFRVNGTNLGTPQAVNAGGQATIITNSINAGADIIRATYSGDATNYSGSTSPNFTQTVTRANTTTTLTLVTPVSRLTTIRYTATVAAVAPGGRVPTGTVRFYRGATLIGSATLTAGVATLRYRNTALATGTYTFHAVYVTSTNYLTSTSANKTQVITP